MAIPGNGFLRRDAAIAYTAMHQRALRDGVSLAIYEGAIRRTYRPYTAQVAARKMWCDQGKCGNAAVPGTSNHGLALATDLMSWTQRNWIDRHGAVYGWAKRWSDAAHEWWHLKWLAGVWKGDIFDLGPRTLKPGCRPGDDVATLKKMLRRLPMKRRGKDGQVRYFRTTWPVDGRYGFRVRKAVRLFQGDHRLTADGICGPQTWEAIRKAAEQEKARRR
jgi:hypothetical protein